MCNRGHRERLEIRQSRQRSSGGCSCKGRGAFDWIKYRDVLVEAISSQEHRGSTPGFLCLRNMAGAMPNSSQTHFEFSVGAVVRASLVASLDFLLEYTLNGRATNWVGGVRGQDIQQCPSRDWAAVFAVESGSGFVACFRYRG